MSRQSIPVIVCIDVEPDKPFNHRSNPMPWEGYLAAVDLFADFRVELARLSARPVHLSWFYRMDPQIEEIHGDPGWVISHYREYFESLSSAGDEAGLHVHPFRWSDAADTWIQDYGNQSWIEHSVRMAFASFRRELERDCVSFRFGDRWMNNRTFRLLESLGVRHDMTLEPGGRKMPSYHDSIPHTGFIPDQRKVPQNIYRPAKSDYQQSDSLRSDGPFVIPVSTAPIHLASSTVYRKPAWYAWPYYRLFNPQRVAYWSHTLNIAAEPAVFRSVLEHHLQTLRSNYLLMPARAHIFTSTEFTDNVRANLRSLFVDYEDSSFVFATPAEALTRISVN